MNLAMFVKQILHISAFRLSERQTTHQWNGEKSAWSNGMSQELFISPLNVANQMFLCHVILVQYLGVSCGRVSLLSCLSCAFFKRVYICTATLCFLTEHEKWSKPDNKNTFFLIKNACFLITSNRKANIFVCTRLETRELHCVLRFKIFSWFMALHFILELYMMCFFYRMVRKYDFILQNQKHLSQRKAIDFQT